MSTEIARRLERLEARTAHDAVMPVLLISEGADIATAWRAQYPGLPFPGENGVFCILLRGVRPPERSADGCC
jgi:hypothetical protein